MKSNWINKDERANKAFSHTKEMSKKYHDEILFSIKNSIITQPDSEPAKVESIYDSMSISVIQGTSTDAIVQECTENTRVAVLNFASYKHAGGGYIKGALAQEECLCADSFLYNVLRADRFSEEFYERNMERLNNGLYNDNLIYVPKVKFLDRYTCDVITCAAPNHGVAIRRGISDSACIDAMRSRINAVLNVAYKMNVETLILGAFGCGVFRNEPLIVASIFREYLTTLYKGAFNNVIFAVPDEPTYTVFSSTFYKP